MLIFSDVYDDRLEIINPGGLPSGITPENFGKQSVRRNSIIADLFHRMHKVERLGSGIERIRSLVAQAKLKQPDITADNFFTITFYRDPKFTLKSDSSNILGAQKKYPENYRANQIKPEYYQSNFSDKVGFK